MCWLSRLLGLRPFPSKPTVKQIYAVHWDIVKAELTELGLELINKDQYIPDKNIYHADEGDWRKLVPYLTFSAEYYVNTPEAPDCDDYAKRASAEAAFEFHLSCLECWGNTPYGRHASNLVRVGDRDYRIFEPNAVFEEAGELFKLGDHGYQPDSWRL